MPNEDEHRRHEGLAPDGKGWRWRPTSQQAHDRRIEFHGSRVDEQ